MEERNESVNLEEELESFRQQWHDELVNDSKELQDAHSTKSSSQSKKATSVEEKAAHLFLLGVKNEKEGHFNAAVHFYRQAVHLVPDIEFKIAEYQATLNVLSDEESDEEDYAGKGSGTCSELQSISESFALMKVVGLCQPRITQQITHISALPTELLISVIKWVVSKDLDIKSLENLSLVCKWFYACAHDAELWKLICIRVWGIHCSSVDLYNNSWRRMFIEKPRVRHGGVYISTNTYVRIGAESLDSFYKPCHLVEYFKYLRFFTDGSVLIYTSADEPQQAIQLLKQPPYRDPSIYRGYYRLNNEYTVNIFFTRITKPTMESRRRKTHREVMDVKEQNFFMQLMLKDVKKKKNIQLEWRDYTYQIKNRKTGVTSESEIDISSFRSYHFTAVRSYCTRSFNSL